MLKRLCQWLLKEEIAGIRNSEFERGHRDGIKRYQIVHGCKCHKKAAATS